jgi:hypothetical protein
MILLRGLAIWFVIVLAKSVHGIARRLLLEPLVGDLQARQISVFTGSAIILAMPFGLLILVSFPLLAAKLRRSI